MFKIVGLFLVSLFTKEVLGHGYMVDPINRSSIWRVNASFPPNYEDNQNFCGGFQVFSSSLYLSLNSLRLHRQVYIHIPV